MSKVSPHSGFTLMELIVVLFIISITLMFAVPEFSGKIFRDDTEITLNWIIFNTGRLKTRSRHEGKDLFMCINPDTDAIRIKEMPQDPDSPEREFISEFRLPDGVRIDGVDFNPPRLESGNDTCIQFYKKGYSDHAVIHVSNDTGKIFSCLIQPFLHKVTIQEGYVRFD